MKKPVLLLVILGALVAFAVYYQEGRNNRINSAKVVGVANRALLLPNLPVGDVRKIRITEEDKTINLVVKGDSWVVQERNDYPAAFDKIQGLVSSLAEMKILSKQVVGKGALGKKKLLTAAEGKDGSGLYLKLMNEKGDVLASLVAGTTQASTGGVSSGSFMGGPMPQRYVRTPKDENTVWLVQDYLADVKPEPVDWINKDLFHITKIKSVDVVTPNPVDSWKAQRESMDKEFVFSESRNGDSLDTAKASGLISLLENASLTDVIPPASVTPDLFKDQTKAKITTFDGFTYDIQFAEKKTTPDADPSYVLKVAVSADLVKERQPAADEKPEDKTSKDEAFAKEKKTLEDKLAKEKLMEPWVFDVSSYVLGDLVKKREAIVRDKAEAAPAPAAAGAPDAAPAPAPAPGPASAPPMPQGQGPLMPKPPVTVTTPPVSVDTAVPAPAPAEAKPEASPAPEAPAADSKPKAE